MSVQGRCGEQNGMFYDRKGDYFREGVDPRNTFGRLVEHSWKPTNINSSDLCVCGEPKMSIPHIRIIDA